MAVDGRYISGKDVDNYEKILKKSAASGGLRTEIESGTEAPDVLMPGSPLKELENVGAKNAKTALDMQKKKEDRLEVKSTVNAAQIKRDRTKKEYDDYVNSQEYRQKRTADIIAQQIAKNQSESQRFASNYTMAPEVTVPQDEKEMRLRAARDQAEKEYNEAEDKKRFEADMEVINGLSEEDRKRLEIYSASKYNDRELPEEYLVDSLLEDFGRERLDELERTYSRYKNAKRAEEVDAKAREFVSKRGGRGTLANILSVPVQAYSGIIGTGGQLAEMMIGTGGYKTQDPNAYGTIGQTLTGAIRGQTSENITEDLGDGFVGKAANLSYQGVMAAADSVARAYLGGGGLGGATLAATNSFSQTMADASRKGATPAQAAMLATTTAGIEALTEKIPLDNLIRTAKGANAKSVIANALRQAGIEATTEEISLLGSVLAEAAILQEKSSYQQDVINGIMSGMSPDEAILQASKNILEEAKNTALISMISGGVSSLGGSYADARGMFAEEQEKNNPALNKPKKGDVIKSREALFAKYGNPEAQQVTQQAQTEEIQQPVRQQPQAVEQEAQRPVQPVQQPVQQVQEQPVNAKQRQEAQQQELRREPEQMPATETAVQQPEQQQETETRQSQQAIVDVLSQLLQQKESQTQQEQAVQPAEKTSGSSLIDEIVNEVSRKADTAAEQKTEATEEKKMYQADLTKYDPKQRAVVQKAMESGVLDNSEQTHKLVDTVAKISSDRNLNFDFVNNEKLKKLGMAVKNATINGFANENGITINVDSPKAWQTLVGHEITHVLEGTDFYPELQKILFAYAKDKGDYQSRYDTISELYQNVQGADINSELTAELVGDYLFTDEKFVNNLSMTNRNLFQKIFDEIKYLFKMVTAGSKEARELEKIKRVFEKAYRNETRVDTRDLVNESISALTQRTAAMKDKGNEMIAQITEKIDAMIENQTKGIGNESYDIEELSKLKAIATSIDDLQRKNLEELERIEKIDIDAEFSSVDKYLKILDDGVKRAEETVLLIEDLIRQGEAEAARLEQELKQYEEELAEINRKEAQLKEEMETLTYSEDVDSQILQELRQLERDNPDSMYLSGAAEAYKNGGEKGLNDYWKRIKAANDRFWREEAPKISPTYKEMMEENQKDNIAFSLSNKESTSITDMQSKSADGGQQTDVENTPPEMQRDRVNAVRKQAIPVTDPQGGNVSEFTGNAYQSALTPDSFTESIQRLVEEGQVSHDVQTNEESLRKGAEMIAKAGTELEAVDQLSKFSDSGKFSPEHIAMGTLLYQDLTSQIDQQAKTGKVETNIQKLAEKTFVSLQQMATNSGRALQLYNLFRKMSPESQARVMEQEVQRNVERMQKAGTVKKDYQTSIDPLLTDMYRQAADEFQKANGAEAKRYAEQKMLDIQNVIYAEEAAKLPTTFKAKWDAWRYMAMLGNVKTQVRNVAGNVLMMPYTEAKRAVGAILEKGMAKDKRTKAVFVDKQLMQWARNDAVNAKSVLDGSAKLGDNAKSNPLADNINTFGTGKVGESLNWIQDKINSVVSGGDMLFKNQEYARSLAAFLKARGYTAIDAQNDIIPVDVMNEARNYAVNEAMKATFNDTNMLSDALANGLRYKGENPVMKAVNMLGEGIMPFRKTPANVVMRFKDYSPAGLVQGVWNMAFRVRNGKVSAATAIDQIASGLTGTAVMQLGYVLAGGIAGVKITGSGADEDEKRQGHQNYALEFSVNGQTYSYTIDWASPANLPLFLGANIRSMQDAPDTASTLTAMGNAARGALEPLLQLSCLSSLNDMFESARYADEGEGLYAFAARGATNYLTQGIPAIARQATQAMTENKQSTFVTSDDPLIQDAQKTIAGLGVGNAYKTDKRNAWGEKEAYGEGLASLTGMSKEVARAVDAFFNPGTLKKVDNSAVEQEIARLNAAGENVSPNYAPKVITYTDKDGNLHKDQRLTEEQYQTYAQTQGQTARQLVEELIKSRSYETMSDEQKAEAINLAYTYARETAEKAAFPDSLGYSEKWLMETDAAKNKAGYILNKVGTAMLSGAMGKIDSAWDNNYSAENVKSLSDQLAKDFEAYSKMPRADKAVVYEGLTGTTKKYVEAREKGVSHDDFLKTAKAINDVKGTGKYDKNTGKNAVRDIDKRAAIAGVSNLTPGARDILMKAYMTDYDPTDESPTKTEPKYDFIRQEMGLSAKDYVDSYRVYLDVSGKNNEIKGIMNAINCDYATARKLRNLYGGWYKGSDWKNYIADY